MSILNRPPEELYLGLNEMNTMHVYIRQPDGTLARASDADAEEFFLGHPEHREKLGSGATILGVKLVDVFFCAGKLGIRHLFVRQRGALREATPEETAEYFARNPHVLRRLEQAGPAITEAERQQSAT